MLIREILTEARTVWARRGGKLKRQYRCTSGPRAGRVYSSAAQCYAPFDIGKRRTLKKTKARLGPRLQRKARRTKRFDPVSRRLRTLNIPKRRR
jgi:hypothetical protein